MRRTRSATTLEELFLSHRATRDPASLGAAFDLAAPALYRLALSWTGDAASAEDAVQETFLAAFAGLDRWDARRPAMPWLAGILRHQAARIRRRTRRFPPAMAVVPPACAAGPSGAAERSEETERIRAAIARLAEPYRSVALLRWRHGLSPAEIAEVRGEPPGTVRSTLTRALARLRRDLRGLAALAFLPRAAGDRAARGLVRVRRDTLRLVAHRLAAATAIALVLGGLAMATKKQVLTAASAGTLLVAGWFGATCAEREAQTPAVSGRPPSAAPRSHAHRDAGAASPAADEAAPAAAVSGDVLRGRVVSRSGDPVPGARVSAFRASVETAVEPASQRSATAGADGTFAVTGLEGPPPYVVAAAAHGFAPRTTTGVRPPGDLTIVLGSPAVFEGRVLGPDDGPVAGARVRVEGVLAGGARFGASATSGPDGAYSVAGLPPIERRHASPLGSLSVEARAEGFAPLLVADVLDVGPQAVPDLAEGRTTRLDLHMVRGAVVTGRVVDENGRAVGGARLALMSYERPLGFGRFADAPRHLASATTAADGTFRFACVPAAGVHRPAILGPILPFGALVALGPDDRTGVATIPVLRDGQTHTVDVALATVAWVTGRAVDEAGAPVAGAAVSARSMADRPMAAAFQGVPGMDVPCPHATTGADGRFRAAVPLGAGAGTRVGVGAEVAAAGARPYRSGERIVDLAPSGTTDAGDVVLHARPPGVHADVVVVDDAGRPVAGAAFRGRDELHMPGSAWGWPATDGGGFSRLSWRPRATDDVPGGPTPREVVVTADGFAAAVLDVAFDASAREPQRIVLETGHRIAGRVRRSDGRPAANAWVLVADAAVPIGEAVPPANSSRGSPERHPAVRGLVLLGVAHTEADGTFRVGDLPARACHVVARAEAFDGPGGRLTETARAWAADVPADTDGLELALPPASGADQPPAAPLDVRVLDDATGRPLAGATADLYDGVTTLRGTAVGEGRIRFGAVPQGIWTLRAAAPRFGDTVVRDVPVGAAAAAPVEVRVARGSAVRGRIEGVGGAALVHLVREDGAVPWFLQPCAISSGDGTFTLEGVATGRYRVVLSATSDPAVALGCADVLEVRAGDTETRFASRVVRTSSGR